MRTAETDELEFLQLTKRTQGLSERCSVVLVRTGFAETQMLQVAADRLAESVEE